MGKWLGKSGDEEEQKPVGIRKNRERRNRKRVERGRATDRGRKIHGPSFSTGYENT